MSKSPDLLTRALVLLLINKGLITNPELNEALDIMQGKEYNMRQAANKAAREQMDKEMGHD